MAKTTPPIAPDKPVAARKRPHRATQEKSAPDAPITTMPAQRRRQSSQPIAPPTPVNKQSRLLALIQRPEGASLDELVTATGWQPHSIRGLISGVLRKKQGLNILLDTTEDGRRAYRIAA